MPKGYLRLAFLKMGRDFMSPSRIGSKHTFSKREKDLVCRALVAAFDETGLSDEELNKQLGIALVDKIREGSWLPVPKAMQARKWGPWFLREASDAWWNMFRTIFMAYLAEKPLPPFVGVEKTPSITVVEQKPAPLPRLILSDPKVAPAPRSPLAVQLGQALAAVLNFHDTDRAWAAKNIFAFFKVSDFQDFLAGIMVPTIAQMQDKILPVLEARYAAGLRECGQVLVDYAAGRLVFEARKSRGIRIGQPNLDAAARKSSRSMPSGAADHLEPEPDSRARFLRASQASCFRDGEPMPPPNRKLKEFNRQELDVVVQELMGVLKGHKGSETALAVELNLPYSTFRRIRSGGAGFMPSPEEMRKKGWPSTLARIDGAALAASPHLKDYMGLGEKAAVVTAPKCG